MGRTRHHWITGSVLVVCVWAAVALTLAALPGRAGIAPRIQSDYCYQLLAADRLCDGHGLTSLQPVAPLQPWQWRYDWGYLTQWPPGYALLVAGVRSFFHLSTVNACQWIAVLACATALIGWYLWLRRIVPFGGAGVLLAAAAAGCALPVHYLVDPSSDALLVAALPLVLLLTGRATSIHAQPNGAPAQPSTLRWCVVGFIAGTLVWLRYAAAFLAPAIGCHLLIQWRFRRSIQLRQVFWFAVSAALPIFALMIISRVFGAGPVQQQLNVGHTIGVHFSPRLVWSAWANFTTLGFYDYHLASKWIWAFWPILLALVSMSVRPCRRAVYSFLACPPVCVSACVLFGYLALLIAATSLFGEKFNYVALMRYYDPVRPFYFALFAAPLLLVPLRSVRIFVGLVCLVACTWIVQQQWGRPYERLLHSRQAATPYGQVEEAFPEGSRQLYGWLAHHAAPELIVISNFHEYVSLETGIPAFPIPENTDTLNRWINEIGNARGVHEVQVLFVLDSDNRWRSYWQPDPSETAVRFGLRSGDDIPQAIAANVLVYPTHTPQSSTGS